MRYLPHILSIIFGIGCLWLASSQWGIGYDPDSIIYEDVAGNLFDGYGIARFNFETGNRYPMTNFPPLYPMVIGLLGQIADSIATGARLLNTILWGVLWLLVSMWVRRGTSQYSVAWITATVLMLNLFIFQVFGTSWSEPLFLVLGLSGLWLIVNYHQSDNTGFLIGAGILFGCAILTRYAGVALVGTAFAILLTNISHSRRRRLTNTLTLGVISGLPLLFWLLRNISVRGDVANRDVGFTPIGVPQLDSTLQTIGSWLLPIPELTVNLVVIGLVGLLMIWTFISVRHVDTRDDIVIKIMRWWVLIYMAFIVMSFTLLDPRIPFNYRILLPAWVGVMIGVGRWLALHWDNIGTRLKLVWRMVVMLLIILNGLLSINWAVIIATSGQQYSSSLFQTSAIIQDLRDNPPDTTLYTNNTFLFHYLTDQPAIMLPPVQTTNFESWQTTRSTDDIVIVFFSSLSQRGWTSTKQLESLLPVTPLQADRAVTLYEWTTP